MVGWYGFNPLKKKWIYPQKNYPDFFGVDKSGQPWFGKDSFF